MSFPASVTVVEVAPRDGLQNQGTVLGTPQKIEFVNRLTQAGLPVIEVGSFVSPKWVPQMADSDAVFEAIFKKPGVRYPMLVPNERGLDRALAAGVKEIAVFTAASETFNQKNINASTTESIQRFRPVTARAREAGVRIRGYISTCFVCPYEGAVNASEVLKVVDLLDSIGVQEFSIGDTIGAAVPGDINHVFEKLLAGYNVSRFALHAHDTRGTALANCYEALRLGISIFDTSAGGVGGCPYAPGAAGNLATEDLVFMLHGLGIETGVDLTSLVDASRYLETLVGPLSGRTYQALRSGAT